METKITGQCVNCLRDNIAIEMRKVSITKPCVADLEFQLCDRCLKAWDEETPTVHILVNEKKDDSFLGKHLQKMWAFVLGFVFAGLCVHFFGLRQW